MRVKEPSFNPSLEIPELGQNIWKGLQEVGTFNPSLEIQACVEDIVRDIYANFFQSFS